MPGRRQTRKRTTQTRKTKTISAPNQAKLDVSPQDKALKDLQVAPPPKSRAVKDSARRAGNKAPTSTPTLNRILDPNNRVATINPEAQFQQSEIQPSEA